MPQAIILIFTGVKVVAFFTFLLVWGGSRNGVYAYHIILWFHHIIIHHSVEYFYQYRVAQEADWRRGVHENAATLQS